MFTSVDIKTQKSLIFGSIIYSNSLRLCFNKARGQLFFKKQVYERQYILTTKHIKCNVINAPRKVCRKWYESFLSEEVERKSFFSEETT